MEIWAAEEEEDEDEDAGGGERGGSERGKGRERRLGGGIGDGTWGLRSGMG